MVDDVKNGEFTLRNGKLMSQDVLLEQDYPFSDLPLGNSILDGLRRNSFVNLSPIQKTALPFVLEGKSVVVHAKSGTGKTCIFVIRALQLMEECRGDLQCIILVPTREIAIQIYHVVQSIGCFYKDLKVESFIGGTFVDDDVIKCENCEIAIGTPGRIKHMLDLGALKTSKLKLLVCDEVDSLLHSTLERFVTHIISILPLQMQTISCTATVSNYVRKLLDRLFPRGEVIYITADGIQKEDPNLDVLLFGITQYVARVPKTGTHFDALRKREKLVEILKNTSYTKCFVFVNYLTMVIPVYNAISSAGFSSTWLSSDQIQELRLAAIKNLTNAESRCVLVATDVAARGIDVSNADLVINVGLPSAANYLHRMGRAGRFGSKGSVVTILLEGAEMDEFKKTVCKIIKRPTTLYILPDVIPTNVLEAGPHLEEIICEPTDSLENDEEIFSFRPVTRIRNEVCNATKAKKSKTRKANRSILIRNRDVVEVVENVQNMPQNNSAFAESCKVTNAVENQIIIQNELTSVFQSKENIQNEMKFLSVWSDANNQNIRRSDEKNISRTGKDKLFLQEGKPNFNKIFDEKLTLINASVSPENKKKVKFTPLSLKSVVKNRGEELHRFRNDFQADLISEALNCNYRGIPIPPSICKDEQYRMSIWKHHIDFIAKQT